MYYAGVDHDELVKLAEKQFSGLRSTYEETDVPEPCRFTGSEVGKLKCSCFGNLSRYLQQLVHFYVCTCFIIVNRIDGLENH